jgi:RNA recognition motif-containing protein
MKEALFMSQKLYVGNLNYKTTEDNLKQLFSQFGEVTSVNILQGRGFGFVEMAAPESAADAKAKLNGTEFDGRKLVINDARPRADHDGGRPGDKRPGGTDKQGGFRKF